VKVNPRVRIALACYGLLAAIVLWRCLRTAEPEYQGKNLSEWIAMLPVPGPGGGRLGSRWEAVNAIREMGSNGLPFLVRWVTYDVPKLEASVAHNMETNASLVPLRGMGRMFLYSGEMRASDSVVALGVLGPRASSAISALGRKLETVRNRETADRIMSVLSSFSDAGIDVAPAMPGMLLAEARFRKAGGTFYARRFGNRFKFWNEALGACLDHPDRTVRKEAVMQLCFMYVNVGDDPVFLRAALKNPDAEIRSIAEHCLDQLSKPPGARTQ